MQWSASLFDFAVHLRRHTGVLCDLFLRKAKFLSLFPHNNAKIHSNFDKNPSYFFIVEKRKENFERIYFAFLSKKIECQKFFLLSSRTDGFPLCFDLQ